MRYSNISTKVLTFEDILNESSDDGLVEVKRSYWDHTRRIDPDLPEWAEGLLVEASYEELPIGTLLITRNPWTYCNAIIVDIERYVTGFYLYGVLDYSGRYAQHSATYLGDNFEVGYYVMDVKNFLEDRLTRSQANLKKVQLK